MGKRAPTGSSPAAQGVPPVDLLRSGEELVLTISLPGLRPEDFRISLSGNRDLVVEGVRHYRHPVSQEQLVLSERPYGPFGRKIPLPYPVDAGRTQVAFENGVLTARLPIAAGRVGLQWDRAGGAGGAGTT